MHKRAFATLFSLFLLGCGGGDGTGMRMPGGGQGGVGSGGATASALDTITAAGLDGKALPSLDQLSPEQRNAVMTSFTLALGVDCGGCHQPNDFQAATREKNIAAEMWERFARSLEHKDKSPLYCDSCHQGKKLFLDRSSDNALAAYMKTNFVTPIARKDGKPHDCATCHGNPFMPMLLDEWGAGT